jgi:hypothetical protein
MDFINVNLPFRLLATFLDTYRLSGSEEFIERGHTKSRVILQPIDWRDG